MAPIAVPTEDLYHLPLSFPSKTNGVTNGTVEDLRMESFEKTDLVLRTFRCLIADLCEQFKGGHPGYGIMKPVSLDTEY